MEECTLNKDCQAITEYTPTCPVILFDQRNTDDTPKQIGTMPCQQLHANVECFVSTAIVSIEGEWTNLTNDSLNSTFVLPTHGTIISFTVNTVPQSEAGGVATKPVTNTRDGDIAQTPKRAHPDEPYNAGFFRFPGIHVDSGSTISVKCQYFETLKFHRKGYFVSLPLYFPPGTIRENANVTIECKLNGLSTDTKVDCWTHHIKLTESPDDETPIRITCTSDMNHCKPLEEEKKQDNETSHAVVDYVEVTGRDFELAYKVDTNAPQMHCIRAVNSADSDSHSESICVFVTPPSTLSTTFGRAFFFLLDKSASMVGEPYREATTALRRALDRLRPSDQFNVCVFDHQHVCYQKDTNNQPTLVPANNEMISNCRSWIDQYQAQGVTSFQQPLPVNLIENLSDHAVFVMKFFDNETSNENKERTQSQNALPMTTLGVKEPTPIVTRKLQNRTEHPDGTVLADPFDIAFEQTEKSDLLPFIVIISDGAVRDGKKICQRVERNKKMRTRIVTLGFGSYCNWSFLTSLAKLGRGLSDIVVDPQKTCIKMDRLMRLANTPVLTDIEIGLKNDEIESDICFLGQIKRDEIELFPFPIPDLFVGAPLVITARYSSDKCPSKITIRGFDCQGDQETMTTQMETRNDVPVDKISVKMQADSMTTMQNSLPPFSINTTTATIEEETKHDESILNDTLSGHEQRKCLNETRTCLYDSRILLYRLCKLCFLLISAIVTVLLIYFWNSISGCDWCMLLVFSCITVWLSGWVSFFFRYAQGYQQCHGRQLTIKNAIIPVCVLEPIVIIKTMRPNLAASVVVFTCGVVCAWSIAIAYLKEIHTLRLKDDQSEKPREYVNVVDKINSLYWIYNENSIKLSGPFNKEQICEMYISREIHGKIKIQNAKASGKDDRDWFDLYLPPLYPHDLRKLAREKYKGEQNAKNMEIQSRFKEYLPNLYEALKAQKLEFNNELINVPQLPTQGRYRYGAIDTIIRVFGTVLMAILQIMFVLMTAFSMIGLIIAYYIVLFILIIFSCIVGPIWCCIVGPIWYCIDKKSLEKFFQHDFSNVIATAKSLMTTFKRTLRRENLNEIVLLGALSKTEKTVILCGAALRNILIVVSAYLLMDYVFIEGGYSEIQSWMVGFVAWSFFISLVELLDVYATTTANVKLMDMIGATSWLINGIHISENVDVKSAGLFRSLMCLLPASVCGFLANYILQERFMLKCKESYMDSNVCFDDGVGCCEVVSSHDLMNAYYFTGGLVSNILASFTVIRISAWMLTFVNPEFKSYSSKKK
eukprot:244830_1